MAEPEQPRSPSKITEEVLNSAIHGVGAIAGIIGLAYGLLRASDNTSTSYTVGFIIYGITLILLMTMSSLYHALIFSRARKVFQVFDHSAILLLIAGSYTPFILYLFSGWQQLLMLVLVWAIAITSIVLKAALPKFMKRFGVAIYISFGWLALLFLPQFKLLNQTTVILLVIGGLLYTIGAGIMAFKKPFTHVGWHIMVVAAATVHYMAILSLQ
jgi:hemolysin III